MSARVVRPAWSAFFAAVVVAACAPAAIEGADMHEPDRGAGAPKSAPTTTDGGSPDTPAKCPHDGPPIDVSGFASCGDGGRCVPSGAIPEKERARLAACPNGFCVPEKIIANKGQHLPKVCASLAGGEGRCVSTVFPDILASKDRLPVDACDANERCAPCFDPITGADTGACRSVSCDAPKGPAKVFAPCCEKSGVPRGRCLPKTLVGEEGAKGLAARECDAVSEVCVPGEQLDPKHVPPKCQASALLGRYDGVCISDCVPRDLFAKIGTSQGSCADGSFCAPCKNPLTGAPTGAPGCS